MNAKPSRQTEHGWVNFTNTLSKSEDDAGGYVSGLNGLEQLSYRFYEKSG